MYLLPQVTRQENCLQRRQEKTTQTVEKGNSAQLSSISALEISYSVHSTNTLSLLSEKYGSHVALGVSPDHEHHNADGNGSSKQQHHNA